MTTLVNALTAAALGAALVTLAGTGSWRLALRVLLDLLMAAGLLRLAGRPALPDLAVVVVIVTLRLGLSTALGIGGGGGTGGGNGQPDPVWRRRWRCGVSSGAIPGINQPDRE